jgi:tetratricopeptide (TPR) repeat protein
MDDEKRAEYEHGLGQVPEDEQQQVASILRAASAHQRAEILYKKKSYQEAFIEAKAAYEGDPSQPDYVALYAWLHTLVHPTEKHQTELNLISATLEKNPNHIQALWYRGQLYKKLQMTSRAMRDFKHIVELKPSHVNAAREVRVHKMRRQSDPRGGGGASGGSSPRASGLFGAFRKKS